MSRATLTVDLDGTLDLTTGEFAASGDVSGATGKLDGATGSLTLVGVQNLLDPIGSFIETVSGEICVDLGGHGSRLQPDPGQCCMAAAEVDGIEGAPGLRARARRTTSGMRRVNGAKQGGVARGPGTRATAALCGLMPSVD